MLDRCWALLCVWQAADMAQSLGVDTPPTSSDAKAAHKAKGSVLAWKFDPFAEREQRLLELSEQLFAEAGLLDSCVIPRATLTAFLKAVARSYRRNAYHNW